MIIVEAKVFERFSAKQNREFDKDARLISQLPGLEAVQVCTVALASSRYFSNAAKYAKSDSLEVFDGLINWSNDKLLNRADSLYKIKKAHLLLEQGTSGHGGAPVALVYDWPVRLRFS
ncbi:MAG: hypothetical protein IPG61_09675 [bacterium]|nr:hypothetical protein [bacterium]